MLLRSKARIKTSADLITNENVFWKFIAATKDKQISGWGIAEQRWKERSGEKDQMLWLYVPVYKFLLMNTLLYTSQMLGCSGQVKGAKR